MTKSEAITELVRIWHSPHLDLSLKAGLAEVIETLKETNQGESLVTDSSDACKESESKLDLIRRSDALDALGEEPLVWYDGEDEIAERNQWRRDKAALESLPSAEPKTGEWETDMVYAGIEFYRCDQCDFRQSEKSRYCPNCGTKMYKDGEDE